jgi:hypothetical protein
MNIHLYRKYLLNWPLNYWDWDNLVVSEEMIPINWRTDWRQCSINHPLVNSGNAYWTNRTTLCKGYKLAINNNIFRPIFSHKRQITIDKFLPNIKLVVHKREKNRKYLELIKIKILPTVIVKLIIKYL